MASREQLKAQLINASFKLNERKNCQNQKSEMTCVVDSDEINRVAAMRLAEGKGNMKACGKKDARFCRSFNHVWKNIRATMSWISPLGN